MTMEFNPDHHKIVAVVTDGDDKGQHFHLSLPDLVQEIHETNVIEADAQALAAINDRLDALDARPSQLVPTNVSQEIPQEFIERLQFIARGMDTLRARLEALERQDSGLSSTDANSLVQGFGARLDRTVEDKIADALGDIRSRLAVIEQRESPQVADQVQKLGKTVHAFGEFIRSIENTVEEKSGELERKYAEIARHIGGVEGRMGKLASVVHGLADVVKHADVEPV